MHTNAITSTEKNTTNVFIGADVAQMQGAIIPYHQAGAEPADVLQCIPNVIPIPVLPFFGPIVPYVSREVFPIRVIYYILQEDDWGVDDHGNHQHPHHHHNHNNHNIHVQHIHVPIALALHPNTILSHDRRRRGNNQRQNQNVRRRYDHHCYQNGQGEQSEHNPRNHGDDHSRRKRVKLDGGRGVDASKKNGVHLCPNSTASAINEDCSNDQNQINPIEKVCDIEGILEHILGYNHNDPQDLLSASLVSRRWLEAGRNDELWKCTCEHVWGDKVGMPLVRRARGGSIGLFWRSLWKVELIRSTTTSVSREIDSSGGSGKSSTCSYDGIQSKMTVRDIKGLFGERPLGRKVVRDAFGACFEKCDMQKAVVDLMPDSLGGEECGMDPSRTLKRARGDGFNYLWFGSFASSIIDSKRTVMTMDELLSRKGFLMHFKVFHPRVPRHNDNEDYHGRRHRYSRRRRGSDDSGGDEEDVSLHFHCICYFDEANEGDGEDGREPSMGKFRLDDSNSSDLEHPQNLTWHWCKWGSILQVGQYPPLVVRRLDDWGWRIENRHVVLYSQ